MVLRERQSRSSCWACCRVSLDGFNDLLTKEPSPIRLLGWGHCRLGVGYKIKCDHFVYNNRRDIENDEVLLTPEWP